MPLYNYILVNTLITFDLENVSRSYIGTLTQRYTIKRMYFFLLLSRSRWLKFKLVPRIPGDTKTIGVNVSRSTQEKGRTKGEGKIA